MFLLLVLWPVVEFYLWVEVVARVGFWNGFLYSLGSAVLGILLIQLQGRVTWIHLVRSLQQGEPPSDALIDGMVGFLGCILLILPGIMTDVVGLILLFPLTRPLVRRLLKSYVMRRVARGGVFVFTQGPFTSSRRSTSVHDLNWDEPAAARDVIDIQKTPLPPGESDPKD